MNKEILKLLYIEAKGFLLLFILFVGFFNFFAVHAFAENSVHNDVDTNKTNLSQIIHTVLDNQKKVLFDIEAEQKYYNETLRDDIVQLSTLRQNIYNDFNKLYQIYWLNRKQVTEQSLVVEQISRFIFQIRELHDPLVHTEEQFQLRLQQLNNIIAGLNTIGEPTAQSMIERAEKLKEFYVLFSARLKQANTITDKILEKLSATYKELEDRMPRYWFDYYVHQNIDFFSNSLVWQEEYFFEHVFKLLKESVLREIPSTAHAWVSLLSNGLLILLPFILLGILAFRFVHVYLPKSMHLSFKHMLKTVYPWIVLGITIQFSSWFGGNRYQFINAVGTFMLCFGQIRLAWQMLCLKREKDQPAKSPFSMVLTVLILSFILITLIDVSVVFVVLWAMFLVFMFLRIRRTGQSTFGTFTFSRYLMRIFYVVMGVGFFIVLSTGLVHLSFFVVLLYMCIMMGLHQVQACLHATSLLNEVLPKSGISALIYGLLLAVALPVVLTLALVSPLSWLLTFPGGEFLIKTMGDFDINIGQISFNALQILSIGTAFYLVKSIISVSCHYIDNTWASHKNEALSALTTPVKTIIFFGFWGVFVLFVLRSVGFNLTNLAVIAGGLSVGIGLGMQSFVQNSFSGFLLIFGQNIREGDMVEVGTITGVVQKVSLRATKVRTFDNAIVFVPNSAFIGSNFINWTHNGHRVRCTILIGVAYASDLEVVKELIVNVLKDNKRITMNPAPMVLFTDFAASSLNFEVRFWIHNVMEQAEIRSEVRFAINTAFKENGIEIPFPQTDIHMDSSVLEVIRNTLPSAEKEKVKSVKHVRSRKRFKPGHVVRNA